MTNFRPRPALQHAVVLAVFCLTSLPLAAQPLDCMIQPHQVLLIGSAVPGVVDKITVERGDTVRRGQVLVQLQSEVERAALSVARERMSQRGEYQAAQGARELARRELSRSTELYNDKFIARTVVDKAQAEVTVADGRTEQAQERRRLSEREVALAAAQLAQRTVHSAIDGVVVDRLVSPGEYVEQKPLLRLAVIDPLRVDVLVPAAAFGLVRAGSQAKVVPELFNGTARSAVVRTVDRVIDAASNTFRVRLELPNPDGSLPAGLRCKVDLGLPASPAAQPALPSPATPSPASARPPLAAPGAASAAAQAPPAAATRAAQAPRRQDDTRLARQEPARPREPASALNPPARLEGPPANGRDAALAERLMRALAAATPSPVKHQRH